MARRSGRFRAEFNAAASCVVAVIVGWAIASPARGQSCLNWTQRSPATSPSAREGHAMAYDSTRHVTVLFGGGTNSGVNGETWEWNGTNWTQLSPVTSPPSRSAHAMVYDSVRGVTVLFGGWISGNNGQTWEWDGTNWTLRSSSGPSPRADHRMAYDSARGVTVLFGGGTNSGANGETWEWNGTDWIQRTPMTSPSPRYYQAMAYDSARGVTVLFGGITGNDETWEWNGAGANGSWTRRFPATSPSSRYGSAIAYDSARGLAVLFGGWSGNSALGDTWEWDGAAGANGTWTQRIPATSPSARYYGAMTYDSARGVMVLFGGYATGDVRNGETWEGTLLAGPSITESPSSQAVCADSSVTFTAAAGGEPPLSFQWRKDTVSISGATSDSYTIDSVQASDVGSYDVVVTNACGSETSDPATLSLNSDDSDSDGTPDCTDGCPDDAGKTAPGVCGCGVADDDSDNDGTPDCADVDRLLHFQGKLRDAGGAAISGTADLTFRFYDAETGGDLLFTETHTGVVVANGLLSVLLGTQTAGGVPDVALERPEVYVGVEVGVGGELSPRSRVPATGYAIKASLAERLVKPGTMNPAVTVDASGNVGVGTSSPSETLHVVGNILATGSITPGSSEALKHDISDVPPEEALAVLRALRPVMFRYNAEQNGETHLGFIAEEVPDLVATAQRRGVDPIDIVAVLTRVLQEQRELAERHAEDLREQREMIRVMQAEMEAMRCERAGGG